jgi:transposase
MVRGAVAPVARRKPKDRAPVLDPGRKRTKSGYLWAIARDDRPWAGPDPPAVAYLYAPGRGAEHAIRPLAGFTGVLQVDGYAAYQALAEPARAGGGPLTLAYCWSHVRRRFHEIAQGGDAPIAEAALQRINALYRVETMIRGHAPEQRQAVRHEQSKPVADDLRTWLDAQLAKVPRHARIAEAIRYALKLWSGLRLFLDDGRIEIDTNVVERAIRPIALNRKNALFAGSDQGGVHWGVIASLIETCKLNAVDPQAYLADVLSRLINRHPASQIDQLMPWAYANRVA